MITFKTEEVVLEVDKQKGTMKFTPSSQSPWKVIITYKEPMNAILSIFKIENIGEARPNYRVIENCLQYYAREHGYKLIHFQNGSYLRSYYSISDSFQGYSMRSCSGIREIYDPLCTIQDIEYSAQVWVDDTSYFLELKPGFLSSINALKKVFVPALKKIGKNYEEVKIKNFQSKDRNISFYYHGHYSKLVINNDESGLYIEDPSLQFRFYPKDKDDIYKKLEELLQCIYKNKRLTNVFEPPKEFFKDRMKTLKLEAHTEQIWTNLTHYIQGTKIEELCASTKWKMDIEKTSLRVFKTSYYLLRVSHVFLVVSVEGKVSRTTAFHSKDEAISFIETDMNNQVKQNIKSLQETFARS